jgi:hypothetical protein
VMRNEASVAPLEEHLLWCQDCLDRAETLDRAINAAIASEEG